jgi:HEAT repeat protein
LKDGLKDESPEVNKEAVAISAGLAPEPEPLTILLESLNHPKPAVAKAAEDALLQVKFDRLHAKGLATALRACKSEAARLRLMDSLVGLKPESYEAGAALADFLRDASPENRSKIIAAIGQLGKVGREAGPALVALLKADDRSVRFEAAIALCKIQSDQSDKAVPPLVAALRVEKPDDTEGLARQLEAHKALVTLGKPAVDALANSLGKEFFAGNPMTLIGASKADARLAVIKTLEAIGADAKGAIQALAEEERLDPWIPNRAVAKQARLKIQQLADEKEK